MKGCVPRIDGVHKTTVTAQIEVSQGKVGQAPPDPLIAPVIAPS